MNLSRSGAEEVGKCPFRQRRDTIGSSCSPSNVAGISDALLHVEKRPCFFVSMRFRCLAPAFGLIFNALDWWQGERPDSLEEHVH